MKKYEEYLNTPYKVRGITEKNYVTKEDETLTIDPETGQYYSMRKVANNKSVMHDGLVYTKIFQDNLEVFMGVSHTALKVLMYGMCTLRPLSEVLVLNSPDVCLACNIGNSSFYNAIYELLEKKIISKRLGSKIEYWYDPNIFFNGNRIKIM
jgi:hypothetical protein